MSGGCSSNPMKRPKTKTVAEIERAFVRIRVHVGASALGNAASRAPYEESSAAENSPQEMHLSFFNA